MILCTSCNDPYPDQGVPYICPNCGGIFDEMTFPYSIGSLSSSSSPGIWRYRYTFGLPDPAPVISLGEGNTPLVWSDTCGKKVAFKCEYQNPTGSFKDRGFSTLVSFLRARDVKEAVEDSSGNAGVSFAAYAARAGIAARVYVPAAASGSKLKQMEAYGANVICVPGPRSNAAGVVRQLADQGVTYASHAYLPFNLPGYATIAYELVEQLGEAPGTFICPAGQGGLLLGVGRGFLALQAAGIIDHTPKLIGVQAQVCSPLYQLFQGKSTILNTMIEVPSLAEGVGVCFPVRSQAVVQMVKNSQGAFSTVSEAEILPGRDELAHRGFYVETTSAIVWSALIQAITKFGSEWMPDPVVVVLTGSGLKTA